VQSHAKTGITAGSFVCGAKLLEFSFGLFRAADMLKHELQHHAFPKQKALRLTELERIDGDSRSIEILRPRLASYCLLIQSFTFS